MCSIGVVMKYGLKEQIQDVVAGAVLFTAFFIMVWVGFALDVATTGM